jgi:hypothetical protein
MTVITDPTRLRSLLTRIASNACRAKAWLDVRDREVGEAHAAALIAQAEDAAKRARLMLMQDAGLREEMLAEMPKETEA